jgi:hypothetical protein
MPVADATGTAAVPLALAGLTFSGLGVVGLVAALLGAAVGRLLVETPFSGAPTWVG